MIYLDSSYLVRLYLRQPGSAELEAWIKDRNDWVCCLHGRLEVVSALKRQQREGHIDDRGLRAALRQVDSDENSTLLRWLPVTGELMQSACERLASLPPTVYLRAADALHLACAKDAGLKEIHSHDRHLLAAAPHFGLKGVDVIGAI